MVKFSLGGKFGVGKRAFEGIGKFNFRLPSMHLVVIVTHLVVIITHLIEMSLSIRRITQIRSHWRDCR